jgi:hypothetical protein
MCVTDLCPSPHGETSSESPPLRAYGGVSDIYNRPEPLGNPARMTKFCGTLREPPQRAAACCAPKD